MTRHAAVDLGATSGRVVVGSVTSESLVLQEVHRFPNGPVQHADGLHWDVSELYRSAVEGLTLAGELDSIGVDSWAIDYGLLADGQLLHEPFCYRDARTDDVRLDVSRRELFELCGLQHLPFTTVYQLAAEKRLADADAMLLIPDLLTYWLTGSRGCELTNASTTGLLDVRTRSWSPLAPAQLGDLVAAGSVRGEWRGVPVIAVGSHDTASAYVGAPLSPGAAVISLGTWGLVGLELTSPVLTDEVFAANFTNELGVDGTVRFLRNVSGLWVLQECLTEWGRPNLVELLHQAADHPTVPLIDIDDPSLLAPGNMAARVAALGGPTDPIAVVRCLVDSLVEALARTVEMAGSLAGQTIPGVNIVGGGSQNSLICQGLATRLGLPVLAGPVEATAVGNVLVQARALGTLEGGLDDLRALVRCTQPVVRYEP